MKKYLYFFCVMILLTLPTQLTAQIRSDFMIDPDTTCSQSCPAVAFDENGNWHLIWASDSGVKHTMLDGNGEVIRAPQYITEKKYWMGWLSLAARKKYAVFVLKALSPSGSYLVGQVFSTEDDTTSLHFGIPTHVVYPWSPDVIFVDDTTFQVAFLDMRSPFMHETVCLNKVTVSNVFIDEDDCIVVNGDTTTEYYRCNQAIIISHPNVDHFAVIWDDNSSGDYKIYGRLYLPDRNSISSRFVVKDNSSAIGAIEADMDSTGDFIVVWSDEIDNCWNVYLRRFFADGMPKENNIKVNNTTDIGSRTYPSISIDYNKKFIVVWDEQGSIIGQRYFSDGQPKGDNFKISIETDTSSQIDPVVLLRNNRIYTAWKDDRAPANGNEDFIWANILDFDNPTEVSTLKHQQNAPQLTMLKNYPNPFNSQTMITYELPRQANISLTIYDILGKEVLNLADENKLSGIHRIIWNGKNKNGTDVTSGVYFVILKTGRMDETEKILLVK